MSKYSILLAILTLGFASAHAGEFRSFQMVKILNSNAQMGCTVIYIDEADCSHEKLVRLLEKEGYKPCSCGWGKRVDGVFYYTGLYAICSETWDFWEHQLREMNEESNYRHAEEFIKNSHFKGVKSNQVFYVAKNHKALIKPWFEGVKSALKRVQQKYPTWMYLYVGRPDEAASMAGTMAGTPSWTRFTHFLAEEKMALGLMALSLLTIGLSSR